MGDVGLRSLLLKLAGRLYHVLGLLLGDARRLGKLGRLGSLDLIHRAVSTVLQLLGHHGADALDGVEVIGRSGFIFRRLRTPGEGYGYAGDVPGLLLRVFDLLRIYLDHWLG
jgi:hypothetical protein